MRKMYNPSDYKDVLGYIALTSDEIKDKVRGYGLEFLGIHSDPVEWRMTLPMFARSFYAYVFRLNDVPTQRQFFDHYLAFNKEFFAEANLGQDIMEGLRARAYRAYPSFVRDICFNKYVQENIKGFTVTYSLELDINEGIDLMLSQGDSHYAVNLYVATKRAYYGRGKKLSRHTRFENVHYIELPVTLGDHHRVGAFSLYGEREFNELVGRLKQGGAA